MATVMIFLCVVLMISYVDSTNKCRSRLVEAQEELNVISSKMIELQKKLSSWTGYKPDTVPRMVAFTARLSHSIELGSKQIIRYDNAITNVGNAYNPKTGIFSVPMSGVYTLSVSMMGQPKNAIHLQLVVDGRELVRLYTGGANSWELASQTINVKLNKDQKVWVQRREATGKNIYGAEAYNVFSAALLKKTKQT